MESHECLRDSPDPGVEGPQHKVCPASIPRLHTARQQGISVRHVPSCQGMTCMTCSHVPSCKGVMYTLVQHFWSAPSCRDVPICKGVKLITVHNHTPVVNRQSGAHN